MSLVYYCSRCAAKISYLTEKPKICPKCDYSFGGALETATKRAEIIAEQQVVVAGKTKLITSRPEDYDSEEDLQELQRLEKLEKLKKRKKYHAVPVRRFEAEDETDEVEVGGGEGMTDEDEEVVDPRVKQQLKRQFLQTLGGEGFRVEGSNESTTFRAMMSEGSR